MQKMKPYGLTNPHPLPQLKTELVWKGKYDEYGRRREVDIAESAMPLQKIDLIYIDPPFDVGADFTMNIPIGDKSETFGKDQSILQMVAYRDMWGKGTDSYLHMMYERLVLMRELLSETGSIYVHCDWRVNFFKADSG